MYSFAPSASLWNLTLDIPDTLIDQGYKRSAKYPLPQEKWQYLRNYLAAEVVGSWLAEEMGSIPQKDPSHSWTLVNGVGLEIKKKRFVVLPDEFIDHNEMVVPQEWLSISNWVGDYYIAATLDIETRSVNLWGYATHEQLCRSGIIDDQDRNYHITITDMTPDLTVLLAAEQLGIAPSRQPVQNLSPVDAARTQNLLDRLANPTVISPRLSIPFTTWAYCLSQPDFGTQLSRRRQGKKPSAPTNLGDWLQNIFPASWRAAEINYAYRGEAEVSREKRIKLVCNEAVFEIALVISLSIENPSRIGVVIYISSINETFLPLLEAEIYDGEGNLLQKSVSNGYESILKMRRFYGARNDQFELRITVQDQETIEEFQL